MIRTGIIWSVLCTAIMAGFVYWTVGQLPETGEFPVHWGPSGAPDRFVPHDEAVRSLWMLPGIALLVTALLAIAPMIDPRKQNIRRASKAYLVLWVAVMIFMTITNIGICFAMLGIGGKEFINDQFVRLIMAGVSALMMVLGNYLPKTKPSFSFGVRTPWTLSSDTTWEKTHRVAGRLMMLAGLIGIGFAFTLEGIWLAFGLPAMTISIALFSMVYSYFVWRNATDKRGQTEYVD